jgi:hypothetical protein
MIGQWLTAAAFWLAAVTASPGPNDITVYATNGNLKPVPVISAYDCAIAGLRFVRSPPGFTTLVPLRLFVCGVRVFRGGGVGGRGFAWVGLGGGWAVAGGAQSE